VLLRKQRIVGPFAGATIVAGSMLGVGIFLAPPLVAGHIQDPFWYMAAWLFGGLVAYSGAVVYAELATRYPEAGGDYVYIHKAFGPSLSFAAGTLLYFGVFAGSIATVAVPIADYLMPLFFAKISDADPGQTLFSLGIVELTLSRFAAIGLIVLLTVINIRGTRVSVKIQVILTVLPMIVIAALFLYVLLSVNGGVDVNIAERQNKHLPFISAGPAMLAIYFAYSGWNTVTYIAGDLENPSKTIPYSLIGGTFGITILYLLVAGGLFFMAGPKNLSNTIDPIIYIAAIFSSPHGITFVKLTIAIALLASVNSTILAGGRVGFSMARYGSLFRSAGKMSIKYGTPHVSITAVSTVAIIYVLTGTFEWLLEFTSLAMFLLSGLTVLSLYVIRNTRETNAPFMATGYPWFPAIILLLSIAVISISFYDALLGEDRFTVASLYPLSGIGLFILVWAGHYYLKSLGE
jgi:basic amino acid/polyamine antiporter, APA family